MKLLICGSRSLDFIDAICLTDIINDLGLDVVDEVISGGSHGPDQAAITWARQYNIPVTIVRPDWDRYGKAAGPIRNREMVQQCDECLAIWDGISRGTKSTIDMTREANKPLWLKELKNR